METRSKVLIVSLIVVVSFAFGRYSVPEKIKEVIKTIEVEKKTTETDTDRQKHREVTVTEEQKPDGTKTTVTKTVEDTNTDRTTKSKESDVKQAEQLKEVTKSGTHVTVDALAALDLDGLTPVYGASVGANVIGPIRVGLFGLSSGVLGASIGLQF